MITLPFSSTTLNGLALVDTMVLLGLGSLPNKENSAASGAIERNERLFMASPLVELARSRAYEPELVHHHHLMLEYSIRVKIHDAKGG